MSASPRWCLGAGVIAPLFIGALALIGGLTAQDADGASDGDTHAAAARPRPSPESPAPVGRAAGPVSPVELGYRDTAIEARLRPLMIQPRLRAGVFGYDMRSHAWFTIDGDRSFAAASLIKIPIAVALLTAVDRGEVSLEEKLSIRPEDVGTGSGSLQYLPLGSSFSLARLCELMIRKSDNTATNMVLARLGGLSRVNGRFALWGLRQTLVRNPLPDLAGTNRTSPRDLVAIMQGSFEGGLLSASSRSLLIGWMSRSHVRSMIPASVARGAFVANKTGDIPLALGDAGYVLQSGGRSYLLAVQVERPRNSGRAKALIRAVSGEVWEAMTGTPSPLSSARRAGGARRGGPPRDVRRTPSKGRSRPS
jgi:beta-lactamase class A